MAESSVLERLLSSETRGPATPPKSDEVVDDYVAFGWLRGVKERAISLELRRRNGNVTAIGYAWLQKVEWNPSTGITLWFGNEKFTIQGQNLNAEVREDVRLFDGLIRHKVPWVQESSTNSQFESDGRSVRIESITP
ncbi:hypothetical protein Pan44_10190 [Caulifigura coniformis]|uniref:Uncharacterized protein n=1 Tax=Caulifigura coniformis TaxID=2527983 RepID=A0A517SA54_9PLAN|nr:hypothetical protein [Caulifigura coniformis]QDT53004.1 hypothetical protein Pan44_10190 [Caulifigura coniformis]